MLGALGSSGEVLAALEVLQLPLVGQPAEGEDLPEEDSVRPDVHEGRGVRAQGAVAPDLQGKPADGNACRSFRA